MAYSRWSNSVWYTYWLAGTDATLCIHHVKGPNHHLEHDDCLDRMTCDNLAKLFPEVAQDEILELMEYVIEFNDDVRSERGAITP